MARLCETSVWLTLWFSHDSGLFSSGFVILYVWRSAFFASCLFLNCVELLLFNFTGKRILGLFLCLFLFLIYCLVFLFNFTMKGILGLFVH